jgi:hypothetical protein
MPGGELITGPPDFVGVGTQRSGTTWWQRLLKRHPAIRTPANRKKEQHFFDQFGRRPMDAADIARYHALFPRGPGELSGEWTPRYMRDIWGPRVLSQAAPDAKLLVMFRDPVERYRSGVLHQGARSPNRSASWLATDAIERGRYAIQLRRVYDYFDRDQVLVLQYEQCIADPLEQYHRTLAFIGAPQHRPKDPKRTRGTAQKSRKEPIWDDLRDAIVEALEDEVVALAELVPELDLSLWKNFAHLGGRSPFLHEQRNRSSSVRPSVQERAPSPDLARPPDFVGVGTADAGCSWWHKLLLEHDAIGSPADRSLDFFATFCTRAMTDDDVGAYRAHFAGATEKVVGEWTPSYMYESWTPMLLERAAPDAKLLVMVMNPIDRYAARLARTRRRRRRETDTLSNTVSIGRYTPQLRGLLEHYDRDRILVLQLERCLEEPAAEYARTLSFLGVADDFRPAGIRRRGVRAARRKFRASDDVLWPDLEVPLVKELEADVAELSALVPDLDLSLWPHFAHLARGLDSRAHV